MGGGGASNVGGTPGANGVIGHGGKNQGNGVVGLGGGQPGPGPQGTGDGGIGVHGLGGPVSGGFFTPPGTAPGAGVIGQGGRQGASTNRARDKHAAGVIGLGGGTGLGPDTLSSHPLSETGGVGVYGKGADLSVESVFPVDAGGNQIPGPNVLSGPHDPGAGVLGRGGIPTSPTAGATKAAGVIGLAGDTGIPPLSETGDSGVYGRGPVGVVGRGVNGVRGHGQTGRGGLFSTDDQPQLKLEPLALNSPTGVRGPAEAGDFLVTKQHDVRGTEVASLWFCTRGGPGTQNNWVKLA